MSIILETKRLILKTPDFSDFDNLVALRTDPEVMKYIGAGNLQTKDHVKEFLKSAQTYFNEYHLGFFSAFEKQTSNFIGQAGLIHLGFDVKQSDFELAYRFHKKHWHQGYATELAKALIDWGFNSLSLSRIIALVHPENERSRKVMEKSGMSYYGKIDYCGKQIPCYEIYKSKIEYKRIELILASLKDYPIIQNLARFYVYDMSEYLGDEEGWETPDNGLFECIDFKNYWEEKNNYPFLVKYANEIVGFAIVDKKGSTPDIDFNMAQFFILRKFKHRGIGRQVAQQLFKKFLGNWEVMVIPGNEGAYRFWRATIQDYTHNCFEEYTREVAHFDNDRKNIFMFNSEITT